MDIEVSQFFIQLYKSNKLLTDSIESICQNYNINHVQLYIIVLSSCKKMNVSMLAETLSISKSAVSQAIVGLLIRRFVSKKVSEENKKVYYVIPTSKGEKIKKEILDMCYQKYLVLKKKLGEENINEFIKLIVKLNETVEEIKSNKEEKIC